MRLKYYLRGLGIGIICTAIIMGIALSGNKKETLTDTEIIERARLLGMVMEEDTKEPKDEVSEVRNPINEKKEDTEEKTEASNSNGSDKESKTEDDKKTQGDNLSEDEKKLSTDKSSEDKKPENEKNNQSEDKKQPKTEGTQELVQIEIKTGEYSDVICQKLFQAGLIADAEAFNRYLTQKGADDSLRVGVYQIPKGSTEDEIIQILQEKTD